MKIVVLDGYTLNPGDLRWEELSALGELEVYERTPADLVVQRCESATVIFTNKTPLSGELIRQLPRLKYIGILATGYNLVDIEAAKSRNIPVCNAADYSSDSVAQMVFAHILNFTMRVAEHSESVRSGDWSKSKDFSYTKYPMTELNRQKMGIVGLGKIGSQVAQIARAFGMEVVAYTRNPDKTPPEGVEWVDMDTLFAGSDYGSLHCPLTEDTEKLVNRERLNKMKPTAFLLNTGRGALVDESALADALNNGTIAGAGIDVMRREPPEPDNPLLRAKNCFITPHIAWAPYASRKRLMQITIDNLKAFLDGNTVNNVWA